MKSVYFLGLCIFLSCSEVPPPIEPGNPALPGLQILVLGNVQDAGSPQANCQKACCKDLWNHPDSSRMVSSLAWVDPIKNTAYLFDATPDFPRQILMMNSLNHHLINLKGIFLTHAHIGHYTGLMHLGKEASNADSLPVYCFERMNHFLRNNTPWSALTQNGNILLKPMKEETAVSPEDKLSVQALLVPHRDEYSETAAFIIQSGNKKALFLPDIDKWEKWDVNIDSLIMEMDYAFIDGTFYNGDELPNRDIKTIPHPFISESLERFASLDSTTRNKIWFIHLNHTNPALNPGSEASKTIEAAGMHVARTGDLFSME